MHKYFLSFIKPYITKKIFLFALMILSSVSALATPYVLKIIIDDIFPHKMYKDLVNLLLILIGIYIYRIISSIITDIIYTKVSKGIIADLRVDIFRRILRKKSDFFREQKPGEIVFLLTNDVGNIQNTLSALVLNVINNLFTVISILVMLLALDVELTFISLLIVPFIIINTKKFIPPIKRNFEKVQNIDSKIYNFFITVIRNIRVIVTYGTLHFEVENAKGLHKQLVTASTKSTLYEAFSRNITTFLMALGPVIVLLFGGKMVFEGVLTIGSLIAFIQYLNRLYTPAVSLATSFNDYERAKISMQRIYKHIEGGDETAASLFNYTQRINKISFRNVGFSYNKGKSVLTNVSLEFEKGKIYGIIGESGSGKSSLVNVLCKLEKPSEGGIYADGMDIQEISNWHDHIALIEKENQLFNDTILYNIKYGSPEAAHELIQKILQDAQLESVISTASDGIETIVSDSATVISDGQKQRISIARALLKYPSVIVFDEATSPLDINLEKTIINNIREKYQDSIIIIITHRLNILKELDSVYKVEDGTIVEATHIKASTSNLKIHVE